MANPALVKKQLVGVFSEAWVEPIANVLKGLGSERAWVVHGSDGLDEITTTGVTKVAALDKGSVSTFTIHPEDANLELVSPKQLKGGLPRQNAIALENLLGAKRAPIAISFYLIPQLPSSSREKLITLRKESN